MKRYCTLLLLMPFLSFAQKRDTIFRYLNENLQLTTKKNAVFYGVSVKEMDHWFLLSVYPDTTPLMKVYFKDKRLQIKDGPYILYYPKNIKAQEGYYSNNKMNGIWHTWYANGQRKDSGAFKDDQMVGEWKTWFKNGMLMQQANYKETSEEEFKDIILTNPKASFNAIKEGTFKSWYANGNKEATGTFENDLMESNWHWYHENGKPSTKEEYKKGKLFAIECFDTTGKATGTMCSISKPAVLKYYGDYKEYIMQHLVWPEEALKKRIEGEVMVHIKVNKKGELENLNLKSDKPILKKAVEDLFTSMKEWYPAISHNRVIDWEDDFIIPFYLSDDSY